MQDLEVITKACSYLLYEYPEAKDVKEYALHRLSIDSLKQFSFGFFPDNKHLSVIESLLGDQVLIDSELVYDRQINDGISNRRVKFSILDNHNLIMPYRDVYGNVIAIVGRTLMSDDERHIKGVSKYKNTFFRKGQHLFGLYEAKRSILQRNFVFIVEGQFDCISAHSKGLTNTIALGSSNMTPDQLALLLRYTDNITLLLDNDEAGKKGTEKIIKNFGKYANIKKLELPEQIKDIDELVNNYDIGYLKEIIQR